MIGDGSYQLEAGAPGVAAPDPEGPEVRAQQDALLHTAQGIRNEWKKLAWAWAHKSEEPRRATCQWDYALREMQWMANDFGQERLWKRHMAHQIAQEAAAAGRKRLQAALDREADAAAASKQKRREEAEQEQSLAFILDIDETEHLDVPCDALTYWVNNGEFTKMVKVQLENREAARLMQYYNAQLRYDADLEMAWLAAEQKAEEEARKQETMVVELDEGMANKRSKRKSKTLRVEVEEDVGDGSMGGTPTPMGAASKRQQEFGRDRRKRKGRDYDDDDYVAAVKNRTSDRLNKMVRTGSDGNLTSSADPRMLKRMKSMNKPGVPRMESLQRMPSHQMLPGRGALPRGPAAGLPHGWTSTDDELLCALVSEFGSNWGFVADVLSSTSALQGVVRRSEWCKQRHALLQKTPAEPQLGPDGNPIDMALTSYASISKHQAKEIMVRTLPVHESMLRRHIEVVAPLAAKLQQRRVQERAQIRETNRARSEPHTSHFKLTQAALQQSGGRILNPLEISEVEAQHQKQRQAAEQAAQQAAQAAAAQAQQQAQQAAAQQAQAQQQQQQQAAAAAAAAVAAAAAQQAAAAAAAQQQQQQGLQQQQQAQAGVAVAAAGSQGSGLPSPAAAPPPALQQQHAAQQQAMQQQAGVLQPRPTSSGGVAAPVSAAMPAGSVGGPAAAAPAAAAAAAAASAGSVLPPGSMQPMLSIQRGGSLPSASAPLGPSPAAVAMAQQAQHPNAAAAAAATLAMQQRAAAAAAAAGGVRPPGAQAPGPRPAIQLTPEQQKQMLALQQQQAVQAQVHRQRQAAALQAANAAGAQITPQQRQALSQQTHVALQQSQLQRMGFQMPGTSGTAALAVPGITMTSLAQMQQNAKSLHLSGAALPASSAPNAAAAAALQSLHGTLAASQAQQNQQQVAQLAGLPGQQSLAAQMHLLQPMTAGVNATMTGVHAASLTPGGGVNLWPLGTAQQAQMAQLMLQQQQNKQQAAVAAAQHQAQAAAQAQQQAQAQAHAAAAQQAAAASAAQQQQQQAAVAAQQQQQHLQAAAAAVAAAQQQQQAQQQAAAAAAAAAQQQQQPQQQAPANGTQPGG